VLSVTPAGESSVSGVRPYLIHSVLDPERGGLSVVEFGGGLPFCPARCFWTYGGRSGGIRGAHAHRECAQFIVCVSGSCLLEVEDGTQRAEYRLDCPSAGVLIPPMVWATQRLLVPETVLMVFASHGYDPGDYIRSRDEYLGLMGAWQVPLGSVGGGVTH